MNMGYIHIDDGGKGGLPVVFAHSFGGNTRQWAAQLDHLRKSRRAIAYDLRGHGRSDAPANHDYDVLHKVIEGTSHWIQMDKPDEFNKLLDEFLSTIN
jgi:pimeloyl-ACP methyl ester carboxylesterase